MKPVVDRLEAQYPDQLQVIRVDIQSEAGKTIAQEYGLFLTPSFLFFDSQGQEILRMVGSLDTNQISDLLEDQR